jgi:hypothetical protein
MAKAKAKKAAPKKAAPKKPAAKKSKRRKPAKPKQTQIVPNHSFNPGDEVWILPLHTVEVERSMNREPMGTPAHVAAVKKDGTLEVSGLKKGNYAAAAPTGNEQLPWRYLQFSVS